MAKILRQYTIKKLRMPSEGDLEHDIEWICNSLGFVTARDQDKTAYRILQALIKAAENGKGLTSDQLTHYVKPTIGSVIYHLKKLMRAGLVVKLNSAYELRMNSLKKTIEEIEREMINVLKDITYISKQIDVCVGLENR
ncbi:MAG: ArsR family transcriptional regulator [Candidatus Aminicenantes bacterium]|nr:ArsR family transcriptional regulator [Candidatus Aminicenantes bacterium]